MPLPSSNERAAKFVQWLLVLPPCLPGALILLVGWARGSLRPTRDAVAAMLARQQADQLYTAGSVALLGGLLMAAFIAWKILRPAPPEEEEGTDAPDSR